jgi:fatty-acid desaturase
VKRPFKQGNYFLNAIQLAGLIAVAIGLYWVVVGAVSAWWLLATFVGHNAIILGVSVGQHRLSAHRAFKCSRFWQIALSLCGFLSGTGSGKDWRLLHITHHTHSDTDRDPHYTAWDYVFWKRYRKVPMDMKLLRPYVGDKVQAFLHDYYVLIVLGMGAVCLAISPFLFLYGYMMSIGTIGIIGGAHQMLAHWGGKPRQMWLLEYVLPLGGEWLHASHHADSKRWDYRTRWYHFDPGALLVKAIRSDR